MTMRQLCLRDLGVGPQVLAAIRLLFPDGTLSMGLAAQKRSPPLPGGEVSGMGRGKGVPSTPLCVAHF